MSRRLFLFFVVIAGVGLLLGQPAFAGEIHKAVRRKDFSTVRSLLKENPARVNERDDRGDGETPLQIACGYNYSHEMIELLLAKGANVNTPNAKGYTPLHTAVSWASEAEVALLLKRGAKINARGGDGNKTPLHLAVHSNKKKICALLKARGADLRAEDRDGYTPSEVATLLGNPVIAQLLRPR